MSWGEIPMKRLYTLDKFGWPVERVKGRWFLNFFRVLIHTRKITFKPPGRDTSLAGYYKLVDGLGCIPLEDVKDIIQECFEYHSTGFVKNAPANTLLDLQMVTAAAYASHPDEVDVSQKGYQSEPNALTRETIEKMEHGEDVKTVDTVEELFKDLDDKDD